MQYSRTQVGIAIGLAVLLIVVFFGYLMWLNNQGPVLARSDERDPLSGIPNSISLNPLRDRSSERAVLGCCSHGPDNRARAGDALVWLA